jgi:hypothetical protein
LNWKEHIARKRKQIDLKTKEINWLTGKKCHLSIENKLLVYKAVTRPIWSYGIELWGCASKSDISHHAEIPIQNSQSHRKCTPVCNKSYSHTDFNIPYVSDVIHQRINKHHNNPEAHPKPLLQPPLQPVNSRRL